MSLTNGAAHGSRVVDYMSRMRIESRGWKIILREIQVRVRGKWLKMTWWYVGNNSSKPLKRILLLKEGLGDG